MNQDYSPGVLARLRDQTKHWRNFVLEFVLIVFGVLLALALNEWRADRAKQQQTRVALGNIVAEIQSNRKILVIVHEKNAVFMREDAAPAPEDQQFTPGVQLKDSAWQHLLRIGASEHVPSELLNELSDLYAIQEVYRLMGFQLTQAYLNAAFQAPNGDAGERGKRIEKEIRGILSLIARLEKGLLDTYDDMQGRLVGAVANGK